MTAVDWSVPGAPLLGTDRISIWRGRTVVTPYVTADELVEYVISNITSGREVLTADRTYYVRTDGSDSNDGLSNTAGGAWLTLNHAWKTICTTLDLAGYRVTISIGSGTFAAGASSYGDTAGADSSYQRVYVPLGAGSVAFVGAGSGSTIVQASDNSNYCGFDIAHACDSLISVSSMTIDLLGTGDYTGIQAAAPVNISISSCAFINTDFSVVYNASVGAKMDAFNNSYTGNPWVVAFGSASARLSLFGSHTLNGTPAWGRAFAVSNFAYVRVVFVTWSGSATGKRYDATDNGVITTFGGGATYIPGSVAGTTASGGQYV